MAEPTQSPALPSTADATPYVPISWTAVAACVVAGLFATLILVLGISAFVNKKPLLAEELLVLPVIAIVLSFAARRVIRNAEGTRTGESLANGAWWTALIFGLGYFAYLIAISFAVRREAAAEVERWVGLVQKDAPEDAFYLTIPPGTRQSVARGDKLLIRSRFGEELRAFKGADLMRLADRNQGEGEFKFKPTGVADWSYKPGTIDCTFNGEVTCPEGLFPVHVALRGVEGGVDGTAGRQWMIVRPQGGGFIRQDKVERTTYGWLLLMMELNGAGFGKMFLDHVAFGPGGHPYLYKAFFGDRVDPQWAAVVRSPFMQQVFSVPLGVLEPGSGAPDGFFTAPGGERSAKRDQFLASWNALGLFEAGRRLKDRDGQVADKEGALKVTDAAIEFYVPVEVPLQSSSKIETARGRLVVATKDPALLAEVKQRKAAALAGEKPSATPPQELERWGTVPWHVVRIESDLVPVSAGGGPMSMGGPGGPGAPPPPGPASGP